MLAWGSITIGMAFVTNARQLLIVRFLLGVAEAGYFPSIIIYFSLWYCKRDQIMRMAILGGAASASGAITGILTYGTSHMKDIGGLKGWQWTFLLEGSPIIPLGLITYILLDNVPNAVQWLNNMEKQLLTNLLRNDAGVADGEPTSNTRLVWLQVRYVFIDWRIYLYGMIAVGNFTAIFYLTTILPTLVESMGYPKTVEHLMTAPPYALAFVHILTERCWDLCSPNISSRLDDRSEKCLADCVERFLDSSNYIMNKISQEGVAARTRINANEFSSLTDFSLGAPDIGLQTPDFFTDYNPSSSSSQQEKKTGEPCDVVQFTEYVRKNIQLYKMINGIELSPYACANFTQNEMATSLRSLNSFLANLIVGGYSTNQCNQQHAQLYSIDYLDAMISANKLLQIIVNELGKHIATYLHCIFVRIIGEQGMHVLDNMYPENIIVSKPSELELQTSADMMDIHA
ncbi:unnamed protein product [Rotaria sp. Silwood1]|nr:unnamed protein product [Rotaria sp. Silwood1]